MPHEADFAAFLQGLRGTVSGEAPHLLELFEVFAEEARFGRAWLEPRLRKVPRGGSILEVGAGLMILSCQLAREGYAVTALEPLGSGFSMFQELQELVRRHAAERDISFALLRQPVEELEAEGAYDMAYSINVMEHVGSVEAALVRVVRALRPSAEYGFFCPNYQFPYEPHFGVPIVGSKRLTWRLFGRTIKRSGRVSDPEGLWRSLNWISAREIDRICRGIPGIEWRYDRAVMANAFERVTHDPQFASRRAPWMRALAGILVSSGMHRLATLLPAAVQPAIDCTIVKKGATTPRYCA